MVTEIRQDRKKNLTKWELKLRTSDYFTIAPPTELQDPTGWSRST